MKKIIFSLLTLVFGLSEVHAQCTPEISSNPANTVGCENLTIQFSDNSNCVIQSRTWDFGDGNNSTVQNPSHSFSAGIVGDTTYTVKLTLMDLQGAESSITKVVTVFKKPEVSFDVSKLTACVIIDTLQFTNTSPMEAGSNVSWDFGDGSIASTDDSPKYHYLSTGTIEAKLTVTNAKLCNSSVTKEIVVNEIPNPNFDQDVIIGCDPLTVEFDNTTVEGTFPVTDWSWDIGGQGSSVNEQPGSFVIAGANTYDISLSATNSAGCTNKTTKNVVVKKTPSIIFQGPAVICSDDTATFSYAGDGLANAEYNWKFKNSIFNSGTGQGPHKAVWTGGGIFDVVLEVTENGCSNIDSTSITIDRLPQVSLASSETDDVICQSENIDFTVAPAGLDSYTFYNNGVEVQTGTERVFSTTSLMSPNSITVEGTNKDGCISKRPDAIVTVVNTKPVVVINMNPLTSCQAEDVVFTATAGFDTYKFSKGYLELQNSTSNTFSSNALENGDEITCTAIEGGCESDDSNVMTVAVTDSAHTPIVNCGASTNNSVIFNWSDDVSITNYEISVDGAAFYAPASRNTETINGLSFGDTTWIQVVGITPAPCGNTIITDSMYCIAIPCAEISFDPIADPTVCEDGTVDLSISSVNTTGANFGVAWGNGAFGKDLSHQFTGTVDTTITVLLNDSSQLGCPVYTHTFNVNVKPLPNDSIEVASLNLCEGKTHVFTASVAGFDQYQYYVNGTKVQDSVYHVFSSSALGTGSTKIVLHTTEKSCVNKDTVDVTIVAKENVVLSVQSDDVCRNAAVTYTATPGYSKYVFTSTIGGANLQDSIVNTYISNTNDSNVTVVATDQFGCETNAKAKNLNVQPLPSVTIASDAVAATACQLDEVGFTATSSTADMYDFYDDDKVVQSSASNIFSTTVIENHDYFVIAKLNGCEGKESDSLTFKVNPTPTVKINKDTAAICIGSSVSFAATGGTSYSWSSGGSATSNAKFTPTTTEYVWVTTTVGQCTSIPDSAHVFVDEEQPVADAGSTQEICRFTSIELQATGGDNYHWFAGDSISDTTISNPVVVPLVEGTYKVEVSNVICVDTAEVKITIDKCLTELPSAIPQVITPNNDGKNDALILDDIDYFPNAKLVVYNRWSQVVFETTSYNNDWKGTTNDGTDLSDGTYFIVLDLGNGHEVYTNYVMIQR